MKEKYKKFLVELIARNPSVKPKSGYQQFAEHLKDTEGDERPTEKQVKSKISSLKFAARARS